jgi:iron(III) transport system substrate-binding protein
MANFNWPRLREEIRWKLIAWRDRWRALPRQEQIGIAGGLSILAAIMLGGALWLTLRGAGPAHGGEAAPQVVLYTSVDDVIAAPIIAAYENASGVTVRLVTDTEATKTTGLIERLLSEKDAPRADVWWSSEALGTATLARQGLLEPFATKAEAEIQGGWPAALRCDDRTWYGFAQRARVIVYNTSRINQRDVPRTLRALTEERFRGRVAMARPQFGTTRSHIAALVALHGEQATRAWVTAMLAADVKLYDGNSAVVRAVAMGEVDLGLTDTDDVWAGQATGWPVAMVYESMDGPRTEPGVLASAGPLVIPNTVALIRGGPNPNQARRLAEFLLSAENERMLARSASRNVPIRPELAREFPDLVVPSPMPLTPAQVMDAMPMADRLIAELFPVR